MKNYISDGRAMYQDYNHGQFSKKLAEWAISRMSIDDSATGKIKSLKSANLDEVKEILKANDVKLPDGTIYTAWYLYNMALADYPKTITTDAQRATFVEETICDPDGCPESVLECFVAKMCTMGVPIFWENYL